MTANIPVYKILRYLSKKKRLYTKMLRIHLFSVFTIKTPRCARALMPLNREDTVRCTLIITYILL